MNALQKARVEADKEILAAREWLEKTDPDDDECLANELISPLDASNFHESTDWNAYPRRHNLRGAILDLQQAERDEIQRRRTATA